ncbi:S-DNA-T family DNA segregation ATPase FtsK/SpoIIIE [Scopulibacillus darangshiensis]|uniref:S-DNA-T family DNA segregation ATPase FtsK/SpoIIIE n=1 Tax=Scopulibacillus darangshiensis TaxID=442528 RepID=A0A4V2SNG8_9BACL|nr:type VII secretion protein EssC [Scopulibacillus darangshiensis]TCP31206.1 S-DNA-T family DNA segregation ATPase FtsK/SpoIIIE [Scopulibacillus darangshiensis]
MSFLWVFYDKTYQQLPINIASLDVITIGSEQQHMLTIRSFPFSGGSLSVKKSKNESELAVLQGDKSIGTLSVTEAVHLTEGQETLSLCLTDSPAITHSYYVGTRHDLTFSMADDKADVYKKEDTPALIHAKGFSFLKVKQQWFVSPSGNGLFLNGRLVTEETNINIGDIITWPYMTISFQEDDVMQITSVEEWKTELPLFEPPISEMKKKYPLYRRTPRMIYDLPDDKVNLSFPSQEGENNNRGLWLTILPPLLMLIVMGIVALVRPRGIFIIISMVMFTTTLFTSTVYYFKEKKNRKTREEKRHRVYTKYLEDKRHELQELAEQQKQVLFFHYPSFERMKYLTEQISDRIWERTLDSNDFLQLRIGIGTVPSSYDISLSSGDMANREIDDLLEQSQVMARVYKDIENVPVTVNLAEGAMGLIGKESVVKNDIHQLIGQLAFSHSYHDLRFVFIFNEEEYKDWEWLKWLPHFQLPHAFAKGFIYNEQTRDQLLSSLYEVIRERDLDEEKGKRRFSPHIVFIITNQQLISEHVILEYLEGNDPHLGISTIFAEGTKENLTEHIHTLVRYINEHEGDILIQNRKATQIPFQLDVHKRENNETFARRLKTLNHQVGMTNSIPTSVSFLELLKAKEVEDLQIDQKWFTTESSKSLAVPVGLKGREDIVELNLHEKAHGPHGLLAGTTGSGKSEFLQTYILSLAVHFHPHEVAFLLIDYKGGGMAQPFKDIPHLLGTITNIEGSKNFSARALASIKSELKRRQRLFDQYQVNHINDYTELYKQNTAEEPLPHLFLISDEFAELKTEEPEFIRELVSAARIGRSLGVHLILATQKPGGVIDDQIWSNARFKVALKVQDASDSKEVLKNADAASITVTGRGYLQVGNNEVYELFQSAWSGAPYMEDTASGEDDVAIVTDLGLIPLSDVSGQEHQKKDENTEIDMIVDKIEELQQTLNIKKLNSPWLPPLEQRIARSAYVSESEGEFYIGLTDEPEKQSQDPYPYQLIEDGNIGVFGSSGYGKSLTVTTLLLGFASSYSAEDLHYYIFDFGNGGLLPLRQMPHTADYFRMDDERKIDKFMRIMKEEIHRRKQLLQKKEVSNIKMYNALSDEPLPLIFIAIDNFDFAKEELEDLEMQLTQFVRDGQSLGIYMIFTATRVNAIRQALMNNLKTKIVHYLMDAGEAQGVIGKLPYALEAIPGRAIIKKDQAYLAQVFLPADGDDDLSVFERVKQDIQMIKARNEGKKLPDAIPMLAPKLTMGDMEADNRVEYKPGLIPLGLDEEFVMPVYVDLIKNRHCLIFGQTQKGKTNVLKVVLNTSLSWDTSSIGVFDSIDRGLSEFATMEGISYVETKEHILKWLDDTEALLQGREEEYLTAVQNGTANRLSFAPLLLVVDGFGRFQQTVDNKIQDRLSMFMKNYSHLGFNLIVAGNQNEFSKGFDTLTTEVKQIRQAVILMKKSEQNLFTFPFNRKETDINPGFGYYVENGKDTKIQIPLCAAERGILA